MPDLHSSFRHERTSINHVLDVGTPLSIFEAYTDSYKAFIDYIKFGWGSALIDPEFKQKKEICDQLGIRTLLGGTFFEYMIYHYGFEAFVEKIKYFSRLTGITFKCGNEENKKLLKILIMRYERHRA